MDFIEKLRGQSAKGIGTVAELRTKLNLRNRDRHSITIDEMIL